MSFSITLLAALGFLILFGALQRVLDRMGMSDRLALLFVAAMIAGSFLPEIPLGDHFRLNIGGAVIPAVLCIRLFFLADTGGEKLRAVLATVLGAALTFGLGRWLPSEPESQWLPDLWIYGIAAGILACVMGRSRRAAFIAGVMGVLLGDTVQGLISLYQGYDVTVALGGAGIMDTALLSAVIAVALTELFGEFREKISRADHSGQHYHDGHFHKNEEGAAQ